MRAHAYKPRHGSRRRARKLAAAGSAAFLVIGFTVTGASAVPSSFVELDGNVVSNGTGTYDWANSGALTTTNGLFSRAGNGGVFNGGQYNGTTTPPTAPATVATDSTIADAEFKVDPLSVDHTDCGNGDPTVYTGAGSETNGDALSTETFGTGSVPNKDDLSNVYALAHRDGATNEVFFGGERVINNGDSHIDFEFLQSEITIPDACSGNFSGHRSQGDFLLSVDFTTGGTLGGTSLYEWHCVKETGTQPADGTECDPTRKGGQHYQQVGNTAITINVNGGGSVGCGGWACRNPDGTSTTSLLQNELMEGGIDLAQLGFTGCVSTFLPHTRSSQSFTATLKDFEVIPFDTCNSPTVTTAFSPASGGKVPVTAHDTAQLVGATSDAGGTITYKLYANNDCTGEIADLTPTTNTVTNGAVPNSKNYTFNDAGTYYFVATYSGDARNTGPVDSGCAAEQYVVNKATPQPHSTPVVQIKDTFTVSGMSSNATGNVAVGLYSNSACTSRVAGTSDETTAISGTSTTVSTSFVAVTQGDYYYKISYAGDTNNDPFDSCVEHVGVTITSVS